MALTQPVGQRAAHLLGLLAHLAGFARLQGPVVQLGDAGGVAALPGLERAGQQGQLGALQAQAQLITQPERGAGLVAHPALVDRGLQPFGVTEAAHRQRRRGQPHQLQQRRRGQGDGGWTDAGHAARTQALSANARARDRGRGRGHGHAHAPARPPHRRRLRARRARPARSRSGAAGAACRPAHGRARASGGRA